VYKGPIKWLLFQMNPESAHHFTTSLFHDLLLIPGMKYLIRSMFVTRNRKLEREVFGIKFPNPVGLAAGFDKNATLYRDFRHLGFGFIEVGTVTPKPQGGNPRPRMFRLPADGGLINRMGFNNRGVQFMTRKLRKRPKNIIIGGNIGKNKVTPNEEAVNDYIECFRVLYTQVDYFTVNVSSPNTPDLRALQDKEPLKKLLSELLRLNVEFGNPKPILLKIAPDLNESQLDDIIEIAQELKLSGIIATNTTIDRNDLKSNQNEINQGGGLSGEPVQAKSTKVIRYLRENMSKEIAIVGVGGIHDEESALEKLDAGADLIQIYTGLIYEGPSLVKRINKAILNRA
jgi:dihydroorotate dehydrogenase